MTLARLAAREFRESLRNYWFWVNSAVFLGGGLVLVLFGQPDATVLGYRGVARSLAGLMQLALFVVPLMAIFPSAAAVAGEREVGTLDYLLAQPVTRGEVFAGKWIGVAAAVLLSLAGGFAVVGGTAVVRGMPAGLLGLLAGLAAMLALAFVSLGTWISVSTSTQGRATSQGLTAWLFFLALGSLGLMGGFVAWGVPAAALEAWAFVNPVEAYRMAMIALLDPGLEMLGPVGAGLAETLGTDVLVALSVGSLAIWAAGAFGAGRRTFRAPERGRPEETTCGGPVTPIGLRDADRAAVTARQVQGDRTVAGKDLRSAGEPDTFGVTLSAPGPAGTRASRCASRGAIRSATGNRGAREGLAGPRPRNREFE